jgi:hypothetical protein
MRPLVIASVCALSAVSGAFAQSPKDTPEQIIRVLARAIFANDTAAYNSVTIPDPRRARLTQGGRGNPDKLRELDADPGLLQIKKERPYLFHGKPAMPERDGAYPVSTTALYVVAAGGQPMVVPLVRQAEGWRVDLRWWLAMLDLQTTQPKSGTADYAARGLTFALVQLDRKEAAKYVTAGADMNVLFAGAPRQREPSGVYEATAMEMPLVELTPGEFAVLPDGRIVEGSVSADVKVLLGLFGPIEVPFVVRHSRAGWRVEPASYLPLLMR